MRDVRQMQYLPNYGAALQSGLSQGQNIRKQALIEQEDLAENKQRAMQQSALSQLSPQLLRGDSQAIQAALGAGVPQQDISGIASLGNNQRKSESELAQAEDALNMQIAQAISEAKSPQEKANIFMQGQQRAVNMGLMTPQEIEPWSPDVEQRISAFANMGKERMTPYQEAQVGLGREKLNIDKNEKKKGNIPLTFDSYFSERLLSEIGDDDELSSEDTKLLRGTVLENMRQGMDLNEAFDEAVSSLALEDTGTRWGPNYELTGNKAQELTEEVTPKKVQQQSVQQQKVAPELLDKLNALQRELEDINKLEQKLMGGT